MAIYYFRNVTGDWGTTANWSTTSGGGATGAIPTKDDDTLFDASSGTCSVSSSNRVCRTLNFTGYTNTITVSTGISVSGSITLASAMGIGGTGFLAVSSSGTITTNNKHWPNDFRFVTPTAASTVSTITLADNLIVSGSTICTGGGASSTIRLSSSISPITRLRVFGDLQTTGSFNTGSTGATVEFCGTGRWSGTGAIVPNLVINTPGTLTISGSVQKAGLSFTYTAGTVIATNSSVGISGVPTATNALNTLNINGFSTVNFNTLGGNYAGNGITHHIHIDSNINTTNFYITGSNTAFTTYFSASNDAKINCSNVQVLGGISGNDKIKIAFAGNGSWSTNSTSGTAWGINTDFSSSGTTTVLSNITVSRQITPAGYIIPAVTMSYIRGGFDPGTSTVTFSANTNLNTEGMTWNNIQIGANGLGGTANVTMSSSLYVSGTLSLAFNSATNLNSNAIYVTGGFKMAGATTWGGTSNIVLNGTNTVWSQTATPTSFTTPIEINTPGTAIITGSVNKNGNLTITKGTVITTDSSLLWTGTMTVNTSSLTYNKITCSANSIFTGSNGFDVNDFRVNPGVNTVWGGGNTYNILQSLTSIDTQVLDGTAPNRALFTGTNNAVFTAAITPVTTMTVSSFVYGSGNLRAGDYVYANGFSTPWQISSTGSAQGGIGTYTVVSNGVTATSRTFVDSGSGAPRPYVRLSTSATQDLLATNAIDVDSSQGQTIIVTPNQTVSGTYYYLQNATNWNSSTTPKTSGYTWVS